MERKGFIGGSDAKRILDGDWHQLWLEKTGRAEPEDLSHQFNVQLGVHTEKFHLGWLKKYHGFDIVPAGERRHLEHQFLSASLDAWCNTNSTFVEVKHSNARANRESMVDWYQPQMAHYCNVVGKDSGWLSYIAGNAAPDFFKMEPSAEYRKTLLDMELAFWWYVTEGVEPAHETEPVPADLAAQVVIDDMRVVDMSGSNEWGNFASIYLGNKDQAKLFDMAKAGLKGLVEADVRIAAGQGISIKRSKSGSLLISEGI